MSGTSLGPRTWKMTRDKEGYREYRIKFLVQVTDVGNDDPNVVLSASGLPLIGAPWAYGNGNDPWCRCWPNVTVTPYGIPEGRPVEFYTAEYLFTNKPLNRCQNSTIDNPLAEPQKVSGSFVNYTKKTTKDKDGGLIASSSHEPIPVDKDESRPTVIIEQNVGTLGLATFSQMINTVNDSPLWGLDERCIKLRNAPWSRKLYGVCTYYYTRRFEFDINYNTFDLDDVADMGFKRVIGEWDTSTNPPTWDPVDSVDRDNPENFVPITAPHTGDQITKPVMLDNNGDVDTSPVASPSFRPAIELYAESNFLTLGIPTSF